MTKIEKEIYLNKHSEAIDCRRICSNTIYWWCGYRSPKHILECKEFKPLQKGRAE